MNYTIFIREPFMVATAPGMQSKYTSEHGGLSKQEVLVHSETSVLDLSNRRGKSLRSVIHVQVTYLKGSYVTEVGMIFRLGVTDLQADHGVAGLRE
jgi:hypothetical protein